jgi:GalNAc-alpha-(1->4)-GalNAc-alpha-(1->3)-diNAcBac-PP-undecaprenol alpha-1,4-N-acetyl-D-galactosaminyltransferase
MRLTLVISSMGSGGAERVMSTLANRWITQGHDVTLITLSAEGSDFYRLDPAVVRIGLALLSPSRNPLQALTATAARVRALRRALMRTRPDAVLSFMNSTNVLTLFAMLGTGVPVVVSERVDPTAMNPGRHWTLLRTLAYRWASTLVVQTDRVARWASLQGWSIPVAVIANPLDTGFLAPVADDGRAKVIVGIGRLAAQKRFDRLIDAFDRVAGAHPEWSLVIAGDGPLRQALESRVAASPAAPRITLCGRVLDVKPLLRGSRVFVLSSEFEGFPNALLEAMASGCAVIATDCPSGPAELVTDGVTGLLVPETVEALAAAMGALLDNPARCAELGAAARKAASEFAPDVIGRHWDGLMESVVGVRGAMSV